MLNRSGEQNLRALHVTTRLTAGRVHGLMSALRADIRRVGE